MCTVFNFEFRSYTGPCHAETAYGFWGLENILQIKTETAQWLLTDKNTNVKNVNAFQAVAAKNIILINSFKNLNVDFTTMNTIWGQNKQIDLLQFSIFNEVLYHVEQNHTKT